MVHRRLYTWLEDIHLIRFSQDRTGQDKTRQDRTRQDKISLTWGFRAQAWVASPKVGREQLDNHSECVADRSLRKTSFPMSVASLSRQKFFVFVYKRLPKGVFRTAGRRNEASLARTAGCPASSTAPPTGSVPGSSPLEVLLPSSCSARSFSTSPQLIAAVPVSQRKNLRQQQQQSAAQLSGRAGRRVCRYRRVRGPG